MLGAFVLIAPWCVYVLGSHVGVSAGNVSSSGTCRALCGADVLVRQDGNTGSSSETGLVLPFFVKNCFHIGKYLGKGEPF